MSEGAPGQIDEPPQSAVTVGVRRERDTARRAAWRVHLADDPGDVLRRKWRRHDHGAAGGAEDYGLAHQGFVGARGWTGPYGRPTGSGTCGRVDDGERWPCSAPSWWLRCSARGHRL